MAPTIFEYLKLLSKLRDSGQHLLHKHFVIGNTSVDYDSCLGAIVYGYLKYLLLNTLYIPLIDCPRVQLSSRFEIMLVLNKLKIEPHSLFYTQDFHGKYSPDSAFCLYDHNVRDDVPNVEEIVDHHFLTNTTCKKTLVTTVSSAHTLLYFWFNFDKIPHDHHLRPLYEKFGVQESITSYDPYADEIMYYGILIDSFNFSPNESERWLPVEKIATQGIVDRIGQSQKLLTFQEIEDVKFNQKMNLNMTLEQIMKKDYKEFSYSEFKIAFSILLLTPEKFTSHFGGYFEYMRKSFKERQLHGYFLMNMYICPTTKAKKRQLMFYTEEKKLHGLVVGVLDKMGMQPKAGPYKQGGYVDPSGKVSRKVLEKFLSQALNY